MCHIEVTCPANRASRLNGYLFVICYSIRCPSPPLLDLRLLTPFDFSLSRSHLAPSMSAKKATTTTKPASKRPSPTHPPFQDMIAGSLLFPSCVDRQRERSSPSRSASFVLCRVVVSRCQRRSWPLRTAQASADPESRSESSLLSESLLASASAARDASRSLLRLANDATKAIVKAELCNSNGLLARKRGGATARRFPPAFAMRLGLRSFLFADERVPTFYYLSILFSRFSSSRTGVSAVSALFDILGFATYLPYSVINNNFGLGLASNLASSRLLFDTMFFVISDILLPSIKSQSTWTVVLSASFVPTVR
jgi:hypothetical protein